MLLGVQTFHHTQAPWIQNTSAIDYKNQISSERLGMKILEIFLYSNFRYYPMFKFPHEYTKFWEIELSRQNRFILLKRKYRMNFIKI